MQKANFFEKRVDQMTEETVLQHLCTGAENDPSLRNASAELAVSMLMGDFQVCWRNRLSCNSMMQLWKSSVAVQY